MTAGVPHGALARWRRPALLAAFAYIVLLGGTVIGDSQPRLQLLDILLGAALVAVYLRRIGTDADRVDQLAVLGWACFVAACLLSNFLRASFDVALSTFGLLAAFHLARRELRDPDARRALLLLLAGLAALLGAWALVSWGSWWLAWVRQFGSLPPLNLRYSGLIFGNQHDVAILLVLCAPAALTMPGRWGRWLGTAIVAVVGAAVLVEGSRNVWLAVVIASLVVGGAWLVARRRNALRPRWLVLAGASLAVVVAVGLGTGLLARLADLSTLSGRALLWRGSLDAWLLDPLGGQGPGSFPWALQLTDYFTRASFTPRHPDNTVLQLLAEGGLLGVAAAGAVVGAVIVGLSRTRPVAWPAVWALAFFASAGLFANPTDFGYLVLVATVWAALAMPAQRAATSAPRAAGRWVGRANLGLAAVALLAALSVAGGGLAHDQAAERARADDAQGAGAWLDVAMALDPSLALYQRERGVLLIGPVLLYSGPGPFEYLLRATALNPSDTAAWRAMAVYERRGAAEAVQRQRSDPTDLVLLATFEDADGALPLLGEALANDPPTSAVLGDYPIAADAAVAAALAYWADEGHLSTTEDLQPAWLVGLSGRTDLAPTAIDAAGADARAAEALIDLLSCQGVDAWVLLNAPTIADLASPWYWNVRYMVERALGTEDPVTLQFGRYVSAAIFAAEAGSPPDSIFINGATDRWGYGRIPLPVIGVASRFPLADDGLVAWLRDPLGTAEARLPASPLAHCAERFG